MIKFGTGGFRAIIGDEITKKSIQQVAQALANVINKEHSTEPVIIGYDRRFMSNIFAEWFAEVLAGNKIKTKLYTSAVPTPTVMYSVLQEHTDYGITITASHNPYMFSGIKITTRGGIDANIEFTGKLEKIANKINKVKSISIEEARNRNLIVDMDNVKDYLKNITKYLSKEIKDNKLKVIFNAMHGVTAEPAKQLFKMLKISKYEIINDSIDPYFEYKLPSPSEDTLQEFAKEVTKGKYNIGLACDGDGDRLGVIDELGNIHGANTVLAILYYYLVKYRQMQGDVVKTQATSIILDKLAESFNYTCHEVPVGFKWVSHKMQETNALIGGESSGGLTVRNYTPCKDSLFAVALILDAMTVIKKPLSKIIEEVKNHCGYISTFVELSATLSNKKKLEKAIKKYSPNFSYKPVKVIKDDGTKYVFEDNSWVMIRFSGTEDLVRYYLEFPTEIEVERNIKAIRTFIDKYQK